MEIWNILTVITGVAFAAIAFIFVLALCYVAKNDDEYQDDNYDNN